MTLHDLSSFGKLFIETSLLPHTTYYKKSSHKKEWVGIKTTNLQALIDSYPGAQLEKKCI